MSLRVVFSVLALTAVPVAALAADPAAPKATETSATVAAQAETTAAATTADAAKPAEKLVCRRSQVTGSRTDNGKVCMTKKQWKIYDRAR